MIQQTLRLVLVYIFGLKVKAIAALHLRSITLSYATSGTHSGTRAKRLVLKRRLAGRIRRIQVHYPLVYFLQAEAKDNDEGGLADKAKNNLLACERHAEDALSKLEGIEVELLHLQEIEASISAAKKRLAPLLEAMDALRLHEAVEI